LSENLHIAEYLIMVIKKVIEDIEKNWIYAIVSDNTANIRNA
jgi:hypothetical protein